MFNVYFAANFMDLNGSEIYIIRRFAGLFSIR